MARKTNKKTAKKSDETPSASRHPKREATEESPVRLEDRTRTELFELAQRLGIAGFAEMSKTELVEAIRRR